MKTSIKGQEIIKEFEELRLEAYLPTPNDVLTIGWGTTRIDGRPVQEGEKIKRERAQDLFNKDLIYFENSVTKLVKVYLTQDQFDALVSFVYNIGVGAFSKSTLLKKLNNKDYNGAQKEFKRWNKQAGKVLRGLVKRRELEAKLFGIIPEKKKVKKKKEEPVIKNITEEEMKENIERYENSLKNNEDENE